MHRLQKAQFDSDAVRWRKGCLLLGGVLQGVLRNTTTTQGGWKACGGISMITDYDKAHISDILAGRGDWFTARLIRLIAAADPINKAKLRRSFPEVVSAFDEWQKDSPE
jgi:hypothetical protein